jgi:proton-translocating NADH-quinone oxidoreductase chain L
MNNTKILIELIFIFIPFFGGLISYIFRRQLGIKGVIWVNVQSLLTGVIFVLIALFEHLYSIQYKTKLIILNVPWIQFNNLTVEWSFLMDSVSLLMASLILIITSLVEIYSIDYMKDDVNKGKFFMLLSFFAFFMLIFVTSGNALQMFIGWEGIGVISFLLINFWQTRLEANRAGLKAILFNKVGDIGFYVFLVLLFYLFNTLDIVVIRELVHFYTTNTLHLFEILGIPKKIYFGQFAPWCIWALELPQGVTNINIIHWLECLDRDFKFSILEFIGFALLTAAAGKSAQFGLHMWLPDAMEGPTPVSSLLHSATMVTAGIYLLIRFNFILNICPHILILISILGAITAFYSGCVALLQMDMKKVVAYSTCSQLGFMMAACGMAAYNIAFFHLLTHAFFKCLLFLTSGSIIHALTQEQDLRKMGNTIKYLPYTTICMLIGNLGLIGLPFFSGFFSKESILLSYFCDIRFGNQVVILLLLLTTFFTTFYSVRVFKYAGLGKKRGSLYKQEIAHEAPIFMAISLFVLSKFTIFFGYITQELFVGAGSVFFTTSIAVVENIQYFEILHLTEKYIPVLGLVFMIFWAFIYYSKYFGILYKYLVNTLITNFLIKEMNPFINSIIHLKESNWYWTIHLYYMLVDLRIRMIFVIFFKLYKALSLRWYFGSIYQGLTLGLYNFSYKIIIKAIDRGYLEIFGAFGLVQLFTKLSNIITKTQTGVLFSYFFVVFCGFFFYIEILSLYV